MTTTTRKTRKAPWAAVLTALLAVLALVFGVMAFAAPATANSSPATECEGVVGYIGFDKIEVEGSLEVGDTLSSGGASITVTADKEGEATGGTWATTPYTVRVVVKSGDKAEPGASGVPGYSGAWWTGDAARKTDQGLSHITFCYAEVPPTPGDVTFCVALIESTTWTYQTFRTADNTTPQSTWTNESGQPLSDFTVGTDADCAPPPPPPPRCAADAAVHAGEVIPEGQTAETFCTLPPPTVTPPVEQTAVVAPVTVEEPVTVAQAEAATVTEEPETVAVPAPATVAMPAAVPAGDGSTVPQVPVALLALLALATAAAVTSGLRMATNR